MRWTKLDLTCIYFQKIKLTHCYFKSSPFIYSSWIFTVPCSDSASPLTDVAIPPHRITIPSHRGKTSLLSPLHLSVTLLFRFKIDRRWACSCVQVMLEGAWWSRCAIGRSTGRIWGTTLVHESEACSSEWAAGTQEGYMQVSKDDSVVCALDLKGGQQGWSTR
jgi:hypothetical protein